MIGVWISLIALYLVLTDAATVGKVIGGILSGVGWLASPKTAITYGPPGGVSPTSATSSAAPSNLVPV